MSFTMSSTIHVIGGLITGIIGVVLAVAGWKKRKLYHVLTGTPTTDIQNVNNEGIVKFTETIGGPVDGKGFVSPINNKDKSVFAMWYIYEWKRQSSGSTGKYYTWLPVDSGMYSVPFHLDDGTHQIQVAIGNNPGDVVWRFGDAHVLEIVGVESDSAVDMTTFVHDHDLEEQSGLSNTMGDVGKAAPYSDGTDPGDRCYAEWAFGPGDEIFLLGHAHAAEGATPPLHSGNLIVEPTNEPFILTETSGDELTDVLSTSYPQEFATSAVAFVLSAILFVAGLTQLL